METTPPKLYVTCPCSPRARTSALRFICLPSASADVGLQSIDCTPTHARVAYARPRAPRARARPARPWVFCDENAFPSREGVTHPLDIRISVAYVLRNSIA